jgi:hypothetical protein
MIQLHIVYDNGDKVETSINSNLWDAGNYYLGVPVWIEDNAGKETCIKAVSVFKIHAVTEEYIYYSYCSHDTQNIDFGKEVFNIVGKGKELTEAGYFNKNVICKLKGIENKFSEYPKQMLRGDAYTPARFWEIVMAETPEQEKKLSGEGFIIKKDLEN